MIAYSVTEHNLYTATYTRSAEPAGLAAAGWKGALYMSLFAQVIKNLRTMDRFSVAVIYHGLQLSCGMLVLSLILFILTGRYGNTFEARLCAQGAADVAPTVLTACIACGLICDIAMRDRKPKDGDD